MYWIEEDTEKLEAICYDDKKDFRIRICYPKYNQQAKNDAIDKFWEAFEKLRENKALKNEYSE